VRSRTWAVWAALRLVGFPAGSKAAVNTAVPDTMSRQQPSAQATLVARKLGLWTVSVLVGPHAQAGREFDHS